MWAVPLLVIAAVAVYVMTPEERQRAWRLFARWIGPARDVLFPVTREPDPFDEALRARTQWPAVTMALVGVNAAVLILVAGVTGAGNPDVLVRAGASSGPVTTNGEWWRLVSAAFVHTGVLHLLINSAALIPVAVIVERLVGHAALAFTYVTTGILAALVALSTDPLGVTTTSSAAVLGVYGAWLAAWLWGTLRRSELSIPLRVVKRLGPAVALFVLFLLVTSRFDATAGVALLAGTIGGLLLSPGIATRQPSMRQFGVPAAIAMALVVAMAVPLRGITDIRPEIARVAEMEDRTSTGYMRAVERFRSGTTTAAKLAEYVEVAIQPEVRAAREHLDTLAGVPPQHAHVLAGLQDYLTLRDRSWVLRVTALRGSKVALLRDADRVEREARAKLETITRGPLHAGPGHAQETSQPGHGVAQAIQ